MTVNKPYTFSSGEILSDEVNANFDELYDALNNDYIDANASIPFNNIPSGPATDPTSANQLARKQYVDRRVKGGVATVTTGGGASGFASVTHGLGTTPTWVVVTGNAPTSGNPNIPWSIVADNFTSTTFRIRVSGSDGLIAGESVTISYVCGV